MVWLPVDEICNVRIDVDVCIMDTVREYAQMFDSGRKFSCRS